MGLHATLNLATATSLPSPSCLQWSADGQLVFATKGCAYILTPEYGITHDNASAIKETKNGEKSIGWFRTIVQFDSGEPCKWPEYSQEWGAVSLGSTDITLRSVAISPSGLSNTSGCIIATLSSNLDLVLWTATKNSLKGEWAKVLDATPWLIESLHTITPDLDQTERTLHAQIVCMSWTPQPDFGITPALGCDGSLLVAGNRAGGIFLLRYLHGSLTMVHEEPIGDHWITHVAFSRWESTSSTETTSGILAYATSAGAVGVLEITQSLVSDPDSTLFGLVYRIETSVRQRGLIYQADRAGITALRWVIGSGNSTFLIIAKPGGIILYSSAWTEPDRTRTIRLGTQKIHKSSSAFHPVTGINYIRRRDELVVTLSDGSFHVIQHLSSTPSISQPDASTSSATLTSQSLSKNARRIFVETEGGDVDSVDMNKITGATMFDELDTMIWAQEVMRPSDFSYKHEAKHNSRLVVARLWDDEGDENRKDKDLLESLGRVLTEAKASSSIAPIALLRPYLFHLADKSKLNTLHDRILSILSQDPPDVDMNFALSSNVITSCPTEQSLTEEVKTRFRDSLRRHLFGYDELVRWRLRLGMADFTWKMSGSEEKRQKTGLVAQALLNTIQRACLRTLIRHANAVVHLLEPADIPFVRRTIAQCLRPGTPLDLIFEAQALAERLKTLSIAGADDSDGGDEKCPACGVVVPLDSGGGISARCENGHVWTRCSITTFILSTPYVRTCIGCSRKAFLPLSAVDNRVKEKGGMEEKVLPPLARGSWVVRELLEGVQKCLVCGNAFVRVL